MKNVQRIIEKYQRLISAILGLIVALCYSYNFIVNISLVLPHIITFSTTALVIEGVVFSILLSLKDSAFVKIIQTYAPDAIEKQFIALKKMVFYSLGVIFLCVVILSVNPEIYKHFSVLGAMVFKGIVALVGSYLFS